MLKVELLLGVAVFALWVYCLVSVLGARDDQVRTLPKLGWFVLVLIFPLVGSILWLVAGRPEQPRAPRTGPASAYPEYDRPGRASAADPESDEEFLRRCRERAEEQRRRHRDVGKQPDADGDGTPDGAHDGA